MTGCGLGDVGLRHTMCIARSEAPRAGDARDTGACRLAAALLVCREGDTTDSETLQVSQLRCCSHTGTRRLASWMLVTASDGGT